MNLGFHLRLAAFFICVVLVMMGALSLAAAPDLLLPRLLPRMILAG